MTDAALNKALAKWAGKDGQALYPDYCNDLNAMATLEAKAPDEYWFALCHTVGFIDDEFRCGVSPADDIRGLAGATARQRAEALARTVGVWQEGE